MNSSAGVVTACVLLAGSVVLLVAYITSVTAELRFNRHETSRFPMFAVRGRLVQLVADGVISEDDPGWQNLYRLINFMLRMDQKLNQLDFVLQYARSQLASDRNPQIRARVAERRRIEKETLERVPEFAAVHQQLGVALGFLVQRRTGLWHWMLLAILRLFAWAITTFVRQPKSAGMVRRAVERPSPETLSRWQAVEDYCT